MLPYTEENFPPRSPDAFESLLVTLLKSNVVHRHRRGLQHRMWSGDLGNFPRKKRGWRIHQRPVEKRERQHNQLLTRSETWFLWSARVAATALADNAGWSASAARKVFNWRFGRSGSAGHDAVMRRRRCCACLRWWFVDILDWGLGSKLPRPYVTDHLGFGKCQPATGPCARCGRLSLVREHSVTVRAALLTLQVPLRPVIRLDRWAGFHVDLFLFS